jgi:Zn-dependent oligopeptidase
MASSAAPASRATFVELPSQLYEHWLEVPAVLEAHARHHETGEPMPADMLERLLAPGPMIRASRRWNSSARRLVDLEFHTGQPPADPMQKQAEVLEGLGMPRAIRMRHATPHFAHVFSGDGYSSGLLQLHVVRGDGRRCLCRLRGGGRSLPPRDVRRSWSSSSCRRADRKMPRRCI